MNRHIVVDWENWWRQPVSRAVTSGQSRAWQPGEQHQSCWPSSRYCTVVQQVNIFSVYWCWHILSCDPVWAWVFVSMHSNFPVPVPVYSDHQGVLSSLMSKKSLSLSLTFLEWFQYFSSRGTQRKSV